MWLYTGDDLWLDNDAAVLCCSLPEMIARGGRSASTLAGTKPVSRTGELLLATLQVTTMASTDPRLQYCSTNSGDRYCVERSNEG